MLLALDVSNTNLKIGLYHGEERRGHWRLRTERERTADEYAIALRDLFALDGFALKDVDAVVIANVVPPTGRPLAELCRRYFGGPPWVVGENLVPRMVVRYSPAGDVGADRLVDAYAAARLYGTPAVVIDFGTATTFDALSLDGEYLGGAIVPGIGISLEALFRSAARLRPVELVKPPRAIGQSTLESIQAGVFYGFAGQVEKIVRHFRDELGPETRVVATGGLAELIAPETDCIDVVDPFLTLEGLRLIWQDSVSNR
jgi:type III pantothenate kinase